MNRVLDIWSDGACSCNPGPGGYSAVIVHDGIVEYKAGYSDYTTNNRMELSGFISALGMAVKAFKQGYEHVNIYTDSKYIENAINCGWLNKWVKNKFDGIKNPDLWENVYYLIGPYKEISVVWVKAHSGIQGNEFADSFAVEAMNMKRESSGTIEI